MLSLAPAAEQNWPGMFWLPPSDEDFSKRDMLRLDDELAGLMEAADMPADQHGANTAKPHTASAARGEGCHRVQQVGSCIVGAVLCCAVLRCAVLGPMPFLHYDMIRLTWAHLYLTACR